MSSSCLSFWNLAHFPKVQNKMLSIQYIVWFLQYLGMYFITYKDYFISLVLEATFGVVFISHM